MEISLKLNLLCEISQSEDNSNIRVHYVVRSWPSHTQVRYPPIATIQKVCCTLDVFWNLSLNLGIRSKFYGGRV